jgi:hypothetical protein
MFPAVRPADHSGHRDSPLLVDRDALPLSIWVRQTTNVVSCSLDRRHAPKERGFPLDFELYRRTAVLIAGLTYAYSRRRGGRPRCATARKCFAQGRVSGSLARTRLALAPLRSDSQRTRRGHTRRFAADRAICRTQLVSRTGLLLRSASRMLLLRTTGCGNFSSILAAALPPYRIGAGRELGGRRPKTIRTAGDYRRISRAN